MPITTGFLLWEGINHFPFISYGKNLFGMRPVCYKSKDLERIKDVYRGTTVLGLKPRWNISELAQKKRISLLTYYSSVV
jgi:hypothetical protein